MTPEEIEAELKNSIAFALGQYGYKPPRSRDADERVRYYSSVADAIIRQLKFTWAFEYPGILRRREPGVPHSNAGFYENHSGE